MEQPSAPERVTIQTLVTMAAAGTPFACLTCYDATTARWLERGGVPVLLVGDTAAEVILGYERTIDMPQQVLLALPAAGRRAASGGRLEIDSRHALECVHAQPPVPFARARHSHRGTPAPGL